MVDSLEVLYEILQHYPPEEALLLEACVHGRKFSVETVVQRGKIVFENITQKRTNETESRFFVEMAHTIPAINLTEEEEQLLLAANRAIINRAIIAHLDFQDGIAHGEYRVTASQQVYMMEIAARNPGDAILQLYLLATGEALEPTLF
jgi:hypothetical protein